MTHETMTIEELFKQFTNGSIFEFENMGQAKLFAVAVKQRFGLESCLNKGKVK
jgi:hypothetical protein